MNRLDGATTRRKKKKKTFLSEAVRVIRFMYVQRVKGFDAPSEPHFDSDETTRWFTSELVKSKLYLEWGSGGSTYLAARHHVPFISIDSDRYFLEAVKKKIASENMLNPATQRFIYADIGLTKGWGRPIVVRNPSKARLEQFRRYSDFPIATAERTVPDFILVDGRFRVACALKSFKALGERGASFRLLVDDYRDRRPYHELENFGKLERLIGRMAVFNGVRERSPAELDIAIEKYDCDPR